MAREKEQTGYPQSALRQEDFSFIQFLEDIDDGKPLSRIDTPTEVKPNRIYEIAALTKSAEHPEPNWTDSNLDVDTASAQWIAAVCDADPKQMIVTLNDPEWGVQKAAQRVAEAFVQRWISSHPADEGKVNEWLPDVTEHYVAFLNQFKESEAQNAAEKTDYDGYSLAQAAKAFVDGRITKVDEKELIAWIDKQGGVKKAVGIYAAYFLNEWSKTQNKNGDGGMSIEQVPDFIIDAIQKKIAASQAGASHMFDNLSMDEALKIYVDKYITRLKEYSREDIETSVYEKGGMTGVVVMFTRLFLDEWQHTAKKGDTGDWTPIRLEQHFKEKIAEVLGNTPAAGNAKPVASSTINEELQTEISNIEDAVAASNTIASSKAVAVLNDADIFSGWRKIENEEGIHNLSADFKTASTSDTSSALSAEFIKKPEVKALKDAVTLDSFIDKTPAELAKEMSDRFKAATDAMNVELTASSVTSVVKALVEIDAMFHWYFTPLLRYVDENQLTLNEVNVYDHNDKMITNYTGGALVIGKTTKTVDLRETPGLWETITKALDTPGQQKVMDKATGVVNKIKRVFGISDSEEPLQAKDLENVKLETVDAISDDKHRITILKGDTVQEKTAERAHLAAGTEYYLMYPDDPKLKELGPDFKNVQKTYDRIDVKQTPSYKEINNRVYVKVQLKTGPVHVTDNKRSTEKRPYEVVYVLASDVIKDKTASKRLGINILSEMFSTRPPGAWRDDSLDDADMDICNTDDGHDTYRKGRGAVPFLSNTNVSDQSISQGQADDAEYANKEKRKIKDAYKEMLHAQPKNSAMYDYALKRIADLTR